MRFNRLRAHHMGVFRDFELDLTATPGPLVALIGGNGSGKTTALELLFGGIFRECPTRGSLADLATARDSFVEVQVSNGKDYTFRQSIDAVSRKGETLITIGTGEPVLASTKVRDGDAWVAQHMPAKETILASLFCAQQSTGFLGMPPGERKGLLLKLIGVERLERLAEAARERARDQKAAVATLVARVEDERRRGGSVEDAEIALADASGAAIAADATAADARQRLADAQAAAAGAKAARDAFAAAARTYDARLRRRDELDAQFRDLESRIVTLRAEAAEEPAAARAVTDATLALDDAQEAERDASARAERARALVVEAQRQAEARAALESQSAALRGRLDGVRARLTDAETRIRNNEAVLAEGDTIRAAVAERDRLVAEEQQARQDAADADADVRLSAQAYQEADRAARGHREQVAAETARAGRLREALAQAEEIEAAARCLPGLNRDVEAAEREVEKAAAALEELQGRRVAGAEERIGGLRSGLSRVIGAERAATGARAYSPEQIAVETIAADDAAVLAADELPTMLAQAAARACGARERAEKARRAVRETDALAALAGRLEEDRAALSAAEAAAANATERAEAAERDRAAASQRQSASAGARDGYLERAALLRSQEAELEPMAAKAVPLAGAEQRLADLRPVAAAARAELDGIVAEAAELDQRLSSAPHPDVEDARRLVARAEQAQAAAGDRRAAAAGAVTAAEQRLAGARLAAARLAELEPQAERASADALQLDGELAAGAPAAPPPPVDVAAIERTARYSEDEARRAAQSVAVAEQRLEQARAGSGRAAELEAELAAAERDLADWARLAADLGRSGLQAALIDAAIPELAEHCNSLLHEAFGPRFTVDLRTQRLDAKGKRELESLDVIVIDTERGREAPAETLSGGERVIVQEALSLALTALACRTAGLEDVDLVRDETGAALDPEKAAQYVRMLRRAADLIGARHILFVSHNPDVHDLADARIEIGAPA